MASSTKNAASTTRPAKRILVNRKTEDDEPAAEPVKQTPAPVKTKSTPAREPVAAPKAPLDSAKKPVAKNQKPVKSTPPKAEKKPVSKVADEDDDDTNDDDETGEEKPKKVKKPEDPAELRAKYIKDFETIFQSAVSKSHFVKIFAPKNNLQIGGIPQQLKKNPELAYSFILHAAGKLSDFDELFTIPEIHDVIVKQGLSEDDIRDTLITVDNYETRRKEDDFKQFQEAKKGTLPNLEERISKILEISKEKQVKMSSQDKIRASFDAYRTSSKVYDVTGWDDLKHVGYKSISKPTGNRSKKIQASTLPIVANDSSKIVQFLSWLNFDISKARSEAGLKESKSHAKE